MSFVGLRVPHETARLLSALEVPGKRVPVSEYHITVAYLGNNVPIEVLAKAMVATFEVTSKTRPFTTRTSILTGFPKGDDGVPIICRVDSDPLHEFRARIKAAYEAHGVPFSNKHPEYRPHVTLAYAEESVPEQVIPTIEWGAHEAVLWGGDDGDQRLIITFPFTIDAQQKMARRVAQRFASAGGLR